MAASSGSSSADGERGTHTALPDACTSPDGWDAYSGTYKPQAAAPGGPMQIQILERPEMVRERARDRAAAAAAEVAPRRAAVAAPGPPFTMEYFGEVGITAN